MPRSDPGACQTSQILPWSDPGTCSTSQVLPWSDSGTTSQILPRHDPGLCLTSQILPQSDPGLFHVTNRPPERSWYLFKAANPVPERSWTGSTSPIPPEDPGTCSTSQYLQQVLLDWTLLERSWDAPARCDSCFRRHRTLLYWSLTLQLVLLKH